jgi:ubiquinone/menaquinone biosynthesis C-methylase UbiE
VIATGAFASARTILDLGGGGGGYAAALAAALPKAQLTLADLPQILPIARRYLKEKALADHVALLPADFRNENCGIQGRTFDCVFLSHVLHDFDSTRASTIVARAACLVKPGGKLVILDVLVPEGGHQNPVEALFDLMMLVEVPQGRTHGLTDVGNWLQSAGMAPPTVHKLFFGTLLESLSQPRT